MLAHLNRCPHCREDVPRVQLASRPPTTAGRLQIRRGLLYSAGRRDSIFRWWLQQFRRTGRRSPIVTAYLAPVVFLSGLGLLLYGFYLRAKSSSPIQLIRTNSAFGSIQNPKP